MGQELPISRDPRNHQPVAHHPSPSLQEGRQEEILMGGKGSRFPGTPSPLSGFQAPRRETRGDYEMGDKTWRVPGTPGTTMSSLAQI